MDANEPVAVPPQDVEMESVDGQEDPPSLAQLSVSPPPQNDPEGDGQNVEGDNDDVTDDDVRDDDAGHEGDEDDDHEGSQGSDDQDDQPEANDPTSHFISVERMDAVEETDTCPACGEVVALQEIVYLVCGHPWCSDCLNNNIRASLSSRRNWPPRCCRYMRDGIDLSTIQNHLEDDVLLRLIEVGEEYTSKNPTFCFDPKCGAFIPEIKSDEPSQWAKCLRCALVTCIQCKGAKDQHPSPDQHLEIMGKENMDLSKEKGWKQCPNTACRRMIERTEGCDHMECECGTHFCYRCGRHLDYSANQADFACNCAGQNPWVEQLENGDPGNPADHEVEDDEDGESDDDTMSDQGGEGNEDEVITDRPDQL